MKLLHLQFLFLKILCSNFFNCLLHVIVYHFLFLDLSLYAIRWIPHLVGHSCVDQGEQAFLAIGHLEQYLLRHINNLKHFMLTKVGLHLLNVNLNILEANLSICFIFANLVSFLKSVHDLIHIIFGLFDWHIE